MAKRLSAVILLLVAACAPAPRTSSAPPSETESAPSPGTETSPTPPTPSSAAPTDATGAPAWAELATSGPPQREDHTWTVVGDGRSALLFGGRDGATTFDDLWAFDLETEAWTRVDAGVGPAARFGHEAVWVDGVGLVIFAGQAGTTFFDDLWAYDPSSSSWTELPPNGARPVARYGSCAAVGPDGRLWISHGFTSDGTRFSDTRAYDFARQSWTDETAAGARPVERCLHGCWWTDDGTLTLYAGQTTGVTALGDRWALRGGAWTEVGDALPPERNLYAKARSDGGTIVFGGQGVDGGFLADLWLLHDDGGDTERLETAGEGPPARAGAEIIRDAERGRYLLFGGRNDGGALGDLWELRGA